MSDIVETLRARADWLAGEGHDGTPEGLAADEIARLRASNADLVEALKDAKAALRYVGEDGRGAMSEIHAIRAIEAALARAKGGSDAQ